jgi:sulfur transfer protein SufE
MEANRLVFRVHAIRRMFQRHIREKEVRHVLETGETIETYPEDRPHPSRLVLGRCESRPLHVVVADDTEGQEATVITVCEPDEGKWEEGFSRRRQ